MVNGHRECIDTHDWLRLRYLRNEIGYCSVDDFWLLVGNSVFGKVYILLMHLQPNSWRKHLRTLTYLWWRCPKLPKLDESLYNLFRDNYYFFLGGGLIRRAPVFRGGIYWFMTRLPRMNMNEIRPASRTLTRRKCIRAHTQWHSKKPLFRNCGGTENMKIRQYDEIDFFPPSKFFLCEELHNLYSATNIIRMIKSRRMRWAEHITQTGRRGVNVWYWLES
jgi:hypothetical protein